MLVQMKVEGLLVDKRNGMYVVLLKEIEGVETLPIWIGQPEAESIALALSQVKVQRPLTHDLIKSILHSLQVGVSRVVITEIKDNTYFSVLYINDGPKETMIDSRPSDAIATALRVNAPIFVEKDILEKKHADELEEWLKNIKPEDFGNMV